MGRKQRAPQLPVGNRARGIRRCVDDRGCRVRRVTGIAALLNDKIYVSTPEYLYAYDLTTWGWIHLLLGVLIGLAGLAVLRGQTWGRFTGMVMAGLSLVANFLFIPHYPFWSILIIALDVAIIWALAVYRRDPVRS